MLNYKNICLYNGKLKVQKNVDAKVLINVTTKKIIFNDFYKKVNYSI